MLLRLMANVRFDRSALNASFAGETRLRTQAETARADVAQEAMA